MTVKINLRRLTVVFVDLAVVIASYFLAFLLRFDFAIDQEFFPILLQTLPIVLIVYPAAAYAFSLYRGIYYFSSFSDLINITKSTASAAVVAGAMILFRRGFYPRSVLIIHPILVFLFMGGVRFGIRLLKNYLNIPRMPAEGTRRVLLVGAGNLGESVLRQISNSPEAHAQVVGFIDEDEDKWGRSIHDRTVFGGLEALPEVLDKNAIDEIVITGHAKRGEILRAIVEILQDRAHKPELKIAPTIDETLHSPGAGLALRRVRPSDLLNRKVVQLDLASIAKTLRKKTVLVTGAGGTIGSELCRQALQYDPETLILVDNHSTSLFTREAELKSKSRATRITAVLGDIRDEALMENIFAGLKPAVVFHAAAHKHVSQLEDNVFEGISNNVLGTRFLAGLSDRHGVETFLLVSTDKAVKPAGVMGATKRAAELVAQDFADRSKTRFVVVRFGNVLGSSGSVLEIFQEQIAKGGPLTVTDPRMTRYFMTVEEAVQLILQAASQAKGGEIFVLNMGTPVKILEMAKNLVLLSGLIPDKDIEIKISGLRPGEKLHEELMEDPTGFEKSSHPDIMVVRADKTALENLRERLKNLDHLEPNQPPEALVERLRQIVPSFSPRVSLAA